ncbi:MAG: hypothetical protein R3Y24_16630 [Eubacteriales bacterium]
MSWTHPKTMWHFCHSFDALVIQLPSSSQPYWINTASNRMIKSLIIKYKKEPEFVDDFERLLTEGTSYVRYDMTTSYVEEATVATLWSLLLNAGYITLSNWECISVRGGNVKIPNQEVKEAFRQVIPSYTGLQGEVVLLGVAHNKKKCYIADREIKTF